MTDYLLEVPSLSDAIALEEKAPPVDRTWDL
jgi:hypothetical protein